MAKKNFDKLPKAEQRVLIAKDLIARLNAKKFKAQPMVYLRAPVDVSDKEALVKDALAKVPCRGCQIGGFFVCAIDRHNSLKINDVSLGDRGDGKSFDADEMRSYLGQWFSPVTLLDVEAVFEGDVSSGGIDFTPICRVFSPDKRMRLIANNIIANKGIFKPNQILKLAAKAG